MTANLKDQDHPEELSMEEILASIRKIISDDNALSGISSGELSQEEAEMDPKRQAIKARVDSPPQTEEDEIVDLNQMVEEDGSVVLLKASPLPTPPDSKRPHGFMDNFHQDPPTGGPRSQEDSPYRWPTSSAGRTPRSASVDEERALLDKSTHRDSDQKERLSLSLEEPQADPLKANSFPSSSLQEDKQSLSPSEKSAFEPLMSAETLSATRAAFNELAYAAASAHQDHQEGAASLSGAAFGQLTIEQLVKQMLKPMLREWLDTNLASLVKWLVAEQIEKMSRQKE